LNYKSRKKNTEDKKRRIWRYWLPKELNYRRKEIRLLMHQTLVKALLTSTGTITGKTAAIWESRMRWKGKMENKPNTKHQDDR
jgi:hypothetical protein